MGPVWYGSRTSLHRLGRDVMKDGSDLLNTELTELNAYARHHFQLYLSWYTFFLTVNFAAIGWFTSVLLTGALKVSLPIIFLTAFFVVQIIISYVASLAVRKHFQGTNNRCKELLDALTGHSPETPSRPQPAMPLQLYSKIIGLMLSTLVTFGLFWLVLLCVSIYLVPL